MARAPACGPRLSMYRRTHPRPPVIWQCPAGGFAATTACAAWSVVRRWRRAAAMPWSTFTIRCPDVRRAPDRRATAGTAVGHCLGAGQSGQCECRQPARPCRHGGRFPRHSAHREIRPVGRQTTMIFGNGEPDSTGGMWLRMLGLDGLWQTANSPAFQEQIAALVAAILESRIRCERIEYKLDAMLDRLGPEFADVRRRHIPASLPTPDRT